ncbi:hypothetical protein AURDEDRAFT_127320 [Auricularia subglabra TFB-10046 SS5]|nr:hypothetical protein AURDEDRAFT_127320 [Auricularia subglabra TFB-10046 SS5]
MLRLSAILAAVGLATSVVANVGLCPGSPVPFYRTVSPYLGPGTGADEHFYTTSQAEVNAAFPRYRSEGSCCMVFTNETQSPGLVPLYRLYTPQWMYDHWYTIDPLERAAAIVSGKHIDEGIAAWVRETDGCGSMPLYRLFKFDGRTGSEDHFYTISKKERDGAVSGAGYTYQGIAAYVWGNCPSNVDFCGVPE